MQVIHEGHPIHLGLTVPTTSGTWSSALSCHGLDVLIIETADDWVECNVVFQHRHDENYDWKIVYHAEHEATNSGTPGLPVWVITQYTHQLVVFLPTNASVASEDFFGLYALGDIRVSTYLNQTTEKMLMFHLGKSFA